MILTNHQLEAVEKLIAKMRVLLAKSGSRICVFKAPTGSGKTIMTAELLRQMAALSLPNRYAFLWIASNDLHTQSKEKVSKYLADSRYSFLLLDEVAGNRFEENQIVFVNWESLTRQDRTTGDFKNVMMRENEMGRNLPNFVAKTKESGLEIILIVDESHYHYWSTKSQELVQGVIAPKLTLEVSATPAVVPTPEELEQQDAGFVSVRFEDVVTDGLIKVSAVINEAFGSYTNFEGTADEAIIEAAIAKRQTLAGCYAKEKAQVNPLLIVQLPSETRETSALDESKLKVVVGILAKKHGITVENGKLGIWLSDTKENLEDISRNDSPVEVLIFKQAIALGWDCPRAQILVMFRDIKSHIFEIQTVGRILRMPEVQHYDTEALNQAYVYTNLDRITVEHDGTSEGYFKVHRAIRKKGYRDIKLPSVYLHRVDYGDLTLAFRRLFFEEANKRFQIARTDTADEAKKKADVDLELLPEELKRPVIADVVIHNLDAQAKKEIFGGETVAFSVSPDEIKRAYEAFAKAASLPFAPVRSHTKIQQGIYDWFDKQLGYGAVSRLEIQRIVVCSEENQIIFREIIEAAKARFREVDKKEKESKQRKREYEWHVPKSDYFDEQYELIEAGRAILVSGNEPSKTLLRTDRSNPEKAFEEMLNKSTKVAWWYKNGVSTESYFAIAYIDSETGFERPFYPDYVARFTDGSIGIYDPKSGFTKTSKETAEKSDALQAYIRKHKRLKLKGGVVSKTSAGLFVFTGPAYTPDDSKWERLEI